MKLLLDTHVWLWLLTRPERVPAPAREAVGDGRTSTYWSTVCAWEIALKHALGKLPLPAPPAVLVAESLAESGASALPITHRHALDAAALPPHHKDPFDRLLVAQAVAEGATLVTGDPKVAVYDVPILWD